MQQENTVKNDGGTQMVVVSTHTEKSFICRPILQFGATLFAMLSVVLSSLAALFALFPA